MAWLTSFRLGPEGYEVQIPMRVVALTMDIKHVETVQKNIKGNSKRTFLKVNVPMIMLQGAAVANDVLSTLQGLYQSQQVLNFRSKTDFAVKNQYLTSRTTTKVDLPNTSASGITITGVFLKTDPNRTGTNYFTAGSFNSTTGEITLGSALPGANTDVFVDYTFTGHKVLMTRLSPVPHQGQFQDLWQVGVELTGA